MQRRLIALAAVAALSATATAAASSGAGWVWQEGDSTAYIGQPGGTNDLVIAAPAGEANFLAGHVRLMSKDGQFVLAHATADPAELNSYVIGTPTRTSLQIGGYHLNDVTSLIVAGSVGQRSDLQQWKLGSTVVAAIDGKGRLRLGSVTLYPTIVNGRVQLYAITAAGKQLIAGGKPAK